MYCVRVYCTVCNILKTILLSVPEVEARDNFIRCVYTARNRSRYVEPRSTSRLRDQALHHIVLAKNESLECGGRETSIRAKIKSLQMAVVVVSTFIFCSAPYHMLELVYSYGPHDLVPGLVAGSCIVILFSGTDSEVLGESRTK